jgi:predicted house-cleaning noncanonical NTP pyrophosphatase (MazG superfamily)
MQIAHNKLVRDRIPEIIQADGGRAVTRVLDENGYRLALLEKLTEESREAREASKGELAGELADVLEVLQAIAEAHSLTWDEVSAMAERKRDERGGFAGRIFLEYVERN